MKEVTAQYRAQDRSKYAEGLAQGPLAGSLAAMEQRYGADLDANSHGQSFLKLFQSRFVPGGLYLLDEPEAPLSPQSQLALLAMIADMVSQNASSSLRRIRRCCSPSPTHRFTALTRRPLQWWPMKNWITCG